MSLTPEKKARYYRYAANTTTVTRNVLGVVVAANALSGDRLLPHVLRHRSVGCSVLVAAIGGLDKLDGFFACKSHTHGMPITAKDSAFDSNMDKKNNKVLGYSFTARNIVDGIAMRNQRMLMHAGVMAGYAIWTNDRDARMADSRANAAIGADTKAIGPNKWKTFAQNAGHSLEASPLSVIVPEVAEATYLTSCVLGEIGLKKADKVHQTPVLTEMVA